MWQSTVSEDNPKAGAGALPDGETGIACNGSDAEPERWPLEETMLGILLRFPATWVC